MWHDINRQIAERLTQAPYNAKQRGEHLREGVCPSCGKKSLWTWFNSPGVVKCDRDNKCGFQSTTKELFPDLFENLNKKYQPTPENPNATADAYMGLVRGFDLGKLQGWYEQGKYWHPHCDKGTATVRFYLDAAKTVMWERLIDDVTITDEDGSKTSRNKNFKGSFKGLWWQPPGMTIEPEDRVYLCEGILDAIALTLNGYKACAIMSSGTYPETSIQPHLGKNVKWIFALDNDHAGRKALRKHVARLRDLKERVSAAISSETEEKADWNDLHKLKKLSEQDMKQYRHLGKLELAQSYIEKAEIIWRHDEKKTYFVYSYGNSTYSFKIDTEEYKKAEDMEHDRDPEEAPKIAFSHATTIRPIATFRMDFLYFQQPENGDDGQYFFRFNFKNHAPEDQMPLSGKVLTANGDFNKAISVRNPSALFEGSTKDLNFLRHHWMGSIPKIVKTLDYAGYDKTTGAYVYENFAVQGGKILKVNKESFFQLRQGGIKTSVDIRQHLTDKAPADWFGKYQTAYGVRGVVVLAWWLGSLYAEQIRAKHGGYPFMAFIGKASSGKTSVVDFLWKLIGRQSEEFNPNTSTLPGRSRKLAEVSNMPVVFNETDNEDIAERNHTKKFNWEEMKDLFDGRIGRVTGQKTQDNATRQPDFRAALMAVQNPEIMASEAINSRFVRVPFDLSHHSSAGKLASNALKMLPIDDVSGWLLHSIVKAEAVLERFEAAYKTHLKTLHGIAELKQPRILACHAQLMALVDCLKLVTPIPDDMVKRAYAEIKEMALERQSTLEEDHPVVQQFWANFDYLNSRAKAGNDDVDVPPVLSQQNLLNHSNNPEQEICVNLEHYRAECVRHALETADGKDLRRWLPTSRSRAYLGNEVIRSRIEKRSVRVYRFKN